MGFLRAAAVSIFPGWMERRARAQFSIARHETAMELLASYAAATKDRLTRDWPSKNDSADSAMAGDMMTINARARLAERDNWAAGSIVDGYRRHVVGTGINCRSNVRDDNGEPLNEFNAAADKRWEYWSTRAALCDIERRKSVVEMQGMAISEFATVGQSFAALIYRRRNGVNELRIRMFEPEQLDHTIISNPANGNEVRQGIEIDSDGGPVAYWVYDRHPYDTFYGQSRRLDATNIIHLMRQTRPCQTHGSTRMTRVLRKLRWLDDYDTYQIIRAKYEAAIGMVIEKTSPDAIDAGWNALPSVSTPVENQPSGPLEIEIQPGMSPVMPDGYTGKFNTPTSPGGTYSPFMLQQLTEVGAGAGLDYPTVARDFKFGSFSSQRQSLLERNAETDPLQLLLVDQWLRPTRDAFITNEIMQGRLPVSVIDFADSPERYLEATWHPQGKQWVDPANQSAAAKIALEQRLTTRDKLIAEMHGENWRNLFDQIDDEQEYAMETLATDTRANGIGLPEVMPAAPRVDPREPKPRGVKNAPTGLSTNGHSRLNGVH